MGFLGVDGRRLFTDTKSETYGGSAVGCRLWAVGFLGVDGRRLLTDTKSFTCTCFVTDKTNRITMNI